MEVLNYLNPAPESPPLAGTRLLGRRGAWQDVGRLENGGNHTQSLLMLPLWLRPPPQYVRDDWRNLSARLLGRHDEGWSVWIDWYEARLAGGVGLSERDEIAHVCLPNEVWAKGRVRQRRHFQTCRL